MTCFWGDFGFARRVRADLGFVFGFCGLVICGIWPSVCNFLFFWLCLCDVFYRVFGTPSTVDCISVVASVMCVSTCGLSSLVSFVAGCSCVLLSYIVIAGSPHYRGILVLFVVREVFRCTWSACVFVFTSSFVVLCLLSWLWSLYS